jgi:hypothetical protein
MISVFFLTCVMISSFELRRMTEFALFCQRTELHTQSKKVDFFIQSDCDSLYAYEIHGLNHEVIYHSI